MENEKLTFIDNIGGRKFTLSLLSLIGIVAVAVTKPEALTTESVIGILGVVAAYSGSNSFITAFAQRGKQLAAAPPVEPSQAVSEPVVDPGLEERVSNLETTQAQIIEAVKQQTGIIARLNSSALRGTRPPEN